MLDNLYRMLTNKTYIGVRVFEENGKACETKAQWEPIINEDLFNRVAEMLKSN